MASNDDDRDQSGDKNGDSRSSDRLINELGPDFPDPEGHWEERVRYWSGINREREPRGKLGAVLARLGALWARQADPRAVSRLDGERVFSDVEWAALGDSALFAKLRRESRERAREAPAKPAGDEANEKRSPPRRCSRRRPRAPAIGRAPIRWKTKR